MFKWNFLYFNLWPLPLVLSLGSTAKSLAPSSHPHMRYLYRLTVSSRSLHFSRLNNQSQVSQPLPVQHMLQPLIHLHGSWLFKETWTGQQQNMVHQPLLLILYHLQTCWQYTLIIQVINEDAGPSINPWGTAPVAGLQQEFTLMITTLWAWQFSQISVHLTVHCPCFTSLPMRMLREAVEKRGLLKLR